VEPTIVVKCPSPEVERLGIRPPMTAQEQYAAVRRLHEFLAGGDTQFAAPRGLALLRERGAFAMEFVQGRLVSDLVRPSAIWRWHELRDAVRTGGLALRHLHTIEAPESMVIDLAEVEHAAFSASRAALGGVDAPVREGWFSPGVRPAGGHVGRVVLLHGDWAPENVMISRDRVFCLDPELTDRGWPEHDLARFLLMLLDRPLFVTTGALGWSELRRDLVSTFLDAYYGEQAVSPLLRPLLVREVAQRWAVRHEEAQRGSAAARKARAIVLTRHFAGVLDEISDPRWPGHAAGWGQQSADVGSTPQS
jgi:aminoglycoside phosphotransferase (APT) family kinase protein